MNMTVLSPAAPSPTVSPITHDVTIVTTRKLAQARVLGVPPEEFGIERGARSIADCNYCFHEVVTRTESQLIAEGFDAEQIRSLGDYTGTTEIETLARDTVGEHFGTTAGGVNSAARLVRITEHYVRMDYEGEGRASLYQVITGGDQGEILRKDGRECVTPFDAIPFATTTPVPVTHRFFGRSIADLVMPVQREKTALKRGALDNLYLHNNPRVEVAESMAGPNTLDDLLVSRPGGVVRTRQPGGLNWQAVPDITTSIYPMLQYLDAELETRTGVSKQAQGLDANALQNQSATAVAQVFSASQMRVKLIARIMAEGVRDIFALLHGTIRKHGQQRQTVRLRNAWVNVDPSRLEDPRRHDHQCRPRRRRQAAGMGQGPRARNDRSARRFRSHNLEPGGVILLCQARIRERRTDHQAMSERCEAEIRADEIRAIVAETLAEQQRLRHGDLDTVVLKTIATILTTFGIEEEDRREQRADFQHLRRWRKSVEQVQSYTFKAVITVIVTGLVGAVWLGAKVVLGK